MRTNIDIDEKLLDKAMDVADVSTKRAAVEEALRLVVQLHRQYVAGMDLAGIGWEGDLDVMREDWSA